MYIIFIKADLCRKILSINIRYFVLIRIAEFQAYFPQLYTKHPMIFHF